MNEDVLWTFRKLRDFIHKPPKDLLCNSQWLFAYFILVYKFNANLFDSFSRGSIHISSIRLGQKFEYIECLR